MAISVNASSQDIAPRWFPPPSGHPEGPLDGVSNHRLKSQSKADGDTIGRTAVGRVRGPPLRSPEGLRAFVSSLADRETVVQFKGSH